MRAIPRSARRARARLRRRDGDDAVREGRLHQQELRRAEPRRSPTSSPKCTRSTCAPAPTSSRPTRSAPTASSSAAFGLADKLHAINVAGRADRARRGAATACTWPARSARSASASSRGARPASTRREAYFREQAQALAEGGVDLFILETFRDLNEIGAAIDAVRARLRPADRRADDDRGRRQHARRHAARAVRAGARAPRRDVIGVNCSVGPAPMLETIERMAAVTRRDALGAAQRRPAARRRGAQHLPLLARVHGVVRAPLHPAQRARRRRLLRDDARAHPADQDGGARRSPRRRACRRRHGDAAVAPPRPRAPRRRAAPAAAGPARREVAARARAGARHVRRGRRAAAAARLRGATDVVERARDAQDPRRRRRQHPRRPARRRAHERAVARRARSSSRRASRRCCTTPVAIATCSASSRTCSARTRWAAQPAAHHRRSAARRRLLRTRPPCSTSIRSASPTSVARLNHGLRRRRAGHRRADGVPHRRVGQSRGAEPRRGAAAVRVQGRGGRRVRGHAAGVRRRGVRALPGADRRRADAGRRGGRVRSRACGTPSSWPTRCPDVRVPEALLDRMRRAPRPGARPRPKAWRLRGRSRRALRATRAGRPGCAVRLRRRSASSMDCRR